MTTQMSDQEVERLRRELEIPHRAGGPRESAPRSDKATAHRSIAFGLRVRQVRRRRPGQHGRPLSQEQLAVLAGCDRQSVNRVENAAYSPSLMRILRLALALGVHPAELFMTDEQAEAWRRALQTIPAVD